MALTPASVLADYSSGIGTQGATLQVKTEDQRVGIGTTNPQGTLQVGTAITMGSGIVTATSFDANTASFSGNVSVGGVLTYEDVTSVDSVGIVTARSNVIVGGGLSVTGISTFNGITTSTTTLFANNFSVSGVSTLGGNVVVGGATTELVVTGDARVTGILTVGTASLTLNGTTGAITGGSLTNAQVAALSTSIVGTGTTVDVFVYDTSKDSDGGAWRKRTQHTSWYNETLNTATRGSRKEFPSVAVIVAETTKVTIYDGDDPDLPMWMVFPSTSSLLTSGSTTPNPSLYALNGDLVFGDSSTYYGALRINFISEIIIAYHDNTSFFGLYKYNISQRSSSNSTDDFVGDSTNYSLVDREVNDVAMTVLPNAPIDDATGLPVPTIAVATDGGISTIKDDGSIASTQRSTNEVHSITFDEDHSQIFSWGTSDNFPRHITRLPISRWINSSTSSTLWTDNYFSSFSEGAGSSAASSSASSGFVTVANSGRHFGIEYGSGGNPDDRLVIFHPLNMTNNTNQNLSAFVTSSYNTGYMNGDCEGVFLSDTTAESLTANTNLAGNATEDATARLTSETYDSGDLSWQMVDNSASANGYVNINLIGLTVGQSYIVSMTWDNNNTLEGGYSHRINHSDTTQTDFPQWSKTSAGPETLTGVFTAVSANDDDLIIYANDITLNVTNFNIRAVDDEDRSVNNKGLAVYGTITKSAVAGSGPTAADLMGYSGFQHTNPDNYLKQPYNSGLDFGTGDFSFTWWQYITGDIANSEYVYDRQGANGNRHAVYYTAANSGSLAFYTLSGSSSEILTTGINSYKDRWACYTVSRSSSGLMQIYVNGELKQSTTLTVRDLTNTYAELFIGIRHSLDSGAATQTKYALMRFSKSIPSAEQIKKIYEDEKVLFQENVKCTLYGSSDLPTALAYDEDEETLYVGTSSGRSDFRGLRRINNTTTAVTTAISASNGLVAEE